MGACGYYVSEQAVFPPAVTLPAVASLLPLARLGDPAAAAPSGGGEQPARARAPVSSLLTNRALVVFALCAMLFTLGNAAMLPLAGNTLTKEAGNFASLLIAGCIIACRRWCGGDLADVGRLAEERGRRLVLLIGFSTLPVRACCLRCSITRPLWW